MKQDIEINKLMVNPKNYRFDPVDNQSEAITLMLEKKGDEIFNLAKHIFQHGLDKAKDSRVMEIKKGLFLILDGNRRNTAIKCLGDPSLVKGDSLKTKFTKILKSKGTIPNEVNCFIYKDEAEAAEWIKLDHTGKNAGVGQDQWEPAGKDRFDYQFGGKISPAMQIINLFERETKHKLQPKDLKMSTIDRILSNPESRSYLGIDVKNKNIILITEKKRAIERLDKFFNKIIVDNVVVKEVYQKQDSIKFMKDLFGSKPKILKKPIIVSPKGLIRKSSARRLKSLPKSADRNTLIPEDCILRIHETKINNIYHELKSAPLDSATNAVGVLFRVFLEINLDYYAQKRGITFGSQIKLAGKITKIGDIFEKNEIATKDQLKNIRAVAIKKNSILSINHFHEYVHCFKTQPVPVDLINNWDNLQEFFEILLIEVAKKYKKKKI